MKAIITGSLGNISRTLTEKLVANGHEVKVISSNPERVKEIEKLKAVPLIGSLEDSEFVTKAFAGSDAAYLMIPPHPRSQDIKRYIKTVGEQYANAVRDAGIKQVVNLSSIGAHLKDGLGPTGSNFYVEQKLNQLGGVNVLHLRPGMFLTNFYGSMDSIRHHNNMGNNFSGLVRLPLTHPRDIAEAAFRALDTLSISGKQVEYVVSEEKNGFEMADILGNAVGNPNVAWVEFADDKLMTILPQSGFSEQMAKVYMVEIGIALREGSFIEDYDRHRSSMAGGTSVQDFAKEFAEVYQYGK